MSEKLTISGLTIAPKVGSYIIPDEWSYGENLLDCEWDGGQFRIPTKAGDLAINIDITGRTIQWGKDVKLGSRFDRWVRIKITFPTDGAWDWANDCPTVPTVTRGYLQVTEFRNCKGY